MKQKESMMRISKTIQKPEERLKMNYPRETKSRLPTRGTSSMSTSMKICLNNYVYKIGREKSIWKMKTKKSMRESILMQNRSKESFPFGSNKTRL
jgi:hypothetical protein